MKKKVFRERYAQQDDAITAEKAIELIDEGMKKLAGEEKKPVKRGRKNAKSNK